MPGGLRAWSNTDRQRGEPWYGLLPAARQPAEAVAPGAATFRLAVLARHGRSLWPHGPLISRVGHPLRQNCGEHRVGFLATGVKPLCSPPGERTQREAERGTA